MAGELKPLRARQERQVGRAVHEAEESTGLQICVYLGPGGEDPRRHAEQLFVTRGLHERPAVLVLVAPDARQVEIVTAADARQRVTDADAQGVVTLMTQRFAAGDLIGGLLAGIAKIADAAGPGQGSGEELPDLLQG
ncbi:MAG: TPM domain-containing protein [Acidimicrobiia bacterium]|nr:TPM domain-containing protein [Acidimicrobiia bacterium]MBV9042907.1 TPM domain-containing protein [Acidimicrobiia bacterium]